ncbi:MAG TPA: response regulator, partial [Vicinamibacteria bacterium]|nr:response regulator [Vicinamibacteria bacterium]
SNEELRSMNEELQSANEELETRKEEIQAANEALERAHTDLQNVLISTEIAVIILEDDFRIRSFTPSVTRVYNLIDSDIGRPLWHQTHSVRDMPPMPDPSDLSEAEPMIEHVVQTTEGRWFVRRVRAYRTRDGRRDGMVVTFTDMTELTESEERLRVLADNVPDIIFRADERLEWTYVNSRFSERTGKEGSEALGAGWMNCLYPEDKGRTREALLRCRTTGKTLQVEHRVRQRDGSYRWFVTRAVPLGSRDERPLEWFGTSTDVHDVKQTQEALRHSEQHQRLALAAGKLGVYEIDLEDQSMILDRRAREILGVSSETLSIEEALSRVHPEDRRAVEKMLESTAQGAANGRSRVEFRTEVPDRGEIWLVANAQVQFGQTTSGLRAIRLIGTLREITERKRAEEELRTARITAESASRAKSQFLANMSHEIRTPMTAILGYADVLAKHLSEEPEALDYVDTIRRNGRYLLEILNDVLDLSKIEADQVDIRIERFRPDSVVTEVRSLMEAQAIEKGIDLFIEFDGELPETIESDPNRLRQILLNLVANAIKFTEHGSVRLFTRLLRETEELQFEVIDTGVGISLEKQQKLFEPFAQADDSPSRRFTGSGLGLTISQRLARLLGGEIRVESELGQGSTFQLTVAAGPLEGVPLVEPSLEIVAPDARGDRALPRLDGRLLVVDDRREVRALAKHFLEEAGAQVETASDGRDAIDAVARAANSDEPFDLVLMDMQMPGMDGYEAVSRLRGDGFENPIIALTAHAMRGERERCLEAGCNDYASKPIHSGELVALIARYLREPREKPLPEEKGCARNDRERKHVERYRILLVDDSEDLLESKRILLESRGHEVRTASSGKAALDALRGFDANVVILDLGLPDMTGHELLAQVKEMTSLRDAVFLALSGRYDEADRKRSLEAGFHAHVVKPAHIDELEAIVAEIRRDNRA